MAHQRADVFIIGPLACGSSGRVLASTIVIIMVVSEATSTGNWHF
jgi:hypothetical protein